jgi:hypothetical protein
MTYRLLVGSLGPLLRVMMVRGWPSADSPWYWVTVGRLALALGLAWPGLEFAHNHRL